MTVRRASEIGAYLYCRRAWWYRRQGHQPENQAELSAGTALHVRHGRRVLAAALLRLVSMILLVAALALLAAYLSAQVQ
jgi:hypothetical protein